jgi:hypothetical protein
VVAVQETRVKIRKVGAALIGWPSAVLLGFSVVLMFIAPSLAVWPLGLALFGIATAVIVSSRTLRQKMGEGMRRLLRKA